VRIFEVTASNWRRLKSRIMEIERASFPASIRDTSEYYARLTMSPTAIFLALSIHRLESIVGYLAADILESFPKVPGVKSDTHFGNDDTIYIASVAVEVDWRHQGLGIALQEKCLSRAAEKGFQRATAHLRHRALARMGLGGRVLQSFDNWYDTGQIFDYVEIPTFTGR
jgi:ribosomal protein S18 acetylase RimI-like enzyme